MEDYKQYINDNADEAERQAAEQVMKGLAGLRLEAKVRQVAAERAALRWRIFWQRIVVFSIALALIAGAIYLFWGNKAPNTAVQPQPSIQQQTVPVPPTQEPNQPQEVPQNKPTSSQPMAQLRPSERLPSPRYAAPDAPMIRGAEEENKARKALLDQLWYVDYPLTGLILGPAFALADESLKKRDFAAAYIELTKLESQLGNNDTLHYLQGHCFLEMGQGKKALSLFNRLQGRNTTWEPQLQWYRGVAMLLADKPQEALEVFKMIAGKPKHRYYREAAKAVALITKRE